VFQNHTFQFLDFSEDLIEHLFPLVFSTRFFFVIDHIFGEVFEHWQLDFLWKHEVDFDDFEEFFDVGFDDVYQVEAGRVLSLDVGVLGLIRKFAQLLQCYLRVLHQVFHLETHEVHFFHSI